MSQNILVIDDFREYLDYLKILIEDTTPLHAITLEDSSQVLNYVQHFRPVAVITDTNMPGFNGIEVLKQVKKEYPFIPIIVLFSGLTGSHLTKQDVLNLGATLVISKQEISELGPFLAKLHPVTT